MGLLYGLNVLIVLFMVLHLSFVLRGFLYCCLLACSYDCGLAWADVFWLGCWVLRWLFVVVVCWLGFGCLLPEPAFSWVCIIWCLFCGLIVC